MGISGALSMHSALARRFQQRTPMGHRNRLQDKAKYGNDRHQHQVEEALRRPVKDYEPPGTKRLRLETDQTRTHRNSDTNVRKNIFFNKRFRYSASQSEPHI